MGKDYEADLELSPEQERACTLLSELSPLFTSQIETERDKAWHVLLDEKNSAHAKQEILKKYFSYRMNPTNYNVRLTNGEQYTLHQMTEIAKTLLDDETFWPTDPPIVMNNLDFFFNSISLEDIILAYHNYRLSQDDESLSHLVKLVGLYVEYALSMDGLQANFRSKEETLSHSQSISLFNNITTFIDAFLREYAEKLTLYKGTYTLQPTSRIDFSTQIDRDAAQSMMKSTPLDIRKSKLKDFLLGFSSLDTYDIFHLEYILDDLYKQAGIDYTFDLSQLSSYIWPTYSDLYQLVENKYREESCSEKYAINSYRKITNILKSIKGQGKEIDFNAEIAVVKEDFEDAEKTVDEADTKAAFDNIQMNIRLFFIILMVTKTIPEFSSNKETIRWRKKTCRSLCELFSDAYACEEIEDEEGIDESTIIENERVANQNKADIYKSFLYWLDTSSTESIMKSRLDFLDYAKAIDAEDIVFLSDCSYRFLERLQSEVQNTNGFSEYSSKLMNELNSGKPIQAPLKVINTLSTAELLFATYANDEYAAQDFDYSSISALYYQAFENAYNDLIWTKYAHYLNEDLIINGEHYVSILLAKYNSDRHSYFSENDPGYGYLPPTKKSYSYYFHNNNDSQLYLVDTTCMYGSFEKLIGLDNACKLPKFYDWFANELGFPTRQAMNTDSVFRNLLNQFRSSVSAAVDNRNNASHGGNIIDITQCTIDRRTVLSELQQIRESSLGLVQQLINIVNYNNSNRSSNGEV